MPPLPKDSKIVFTICKTVDPTHGDEMILALEIPVKIVRELTLRPYKWLRFLGFAILGIEGHLSRTESGEPLTEIDYSSDILLENNPVYWYHIDVRTDFTLVTAVNPRLTIRSPSPAWASRVPRHAAFMYVS
jgi:hypothetical protein